MDVSVANRDPQDTFSEGYKVPSNYPSRDLTSRPGFLSGIYVFEGMNRYHDVF